MSGESIDLSISEIIRVQDSLNTDPEARTSNGEPTSQDLASQDRRAGQDITIQDPTPAGPDGDPDDPSSFANLIGPALIALDIPDVDDPPSITNTLAPAVTGDIPDADHTTQSLLQPTPSSATGDGRPSLEGGVIRPAAGTQSVDSDGPRSSHDSDDRYDSSDGDEGLSVAMKAGIGAGVGVVGFILIGLAVFLFLRRRHHRRGQTATAVADETPLAPPAADLLRDKEMMHVAAAPPGFADTTQQQQPPAPSREDGNAPGVDEPPPPPPPPPAGRRAVSSTVAHLVEDGMTDAEIRRLEEEERALDRAIEEQAVRR